MKDAPGRVDRSVSTVYRWLAEGRIRTIRPGRVLWLNLADLLVADSETTTRYRVRDTPDTQDVA